MTKNICTFSNFSLASLIEQIGFTSKQRAFYIDSSRFAGLKQKAFEEIGLLLHLPFFQ
jgi:hypothetical protein